MKHISKNIIKYQDDPFYDPEINIFLVDDNNIPYYNSNFDTNIMDNIVISSVGENAEAKSQDVDQPALDFNQ
jgi:hypothetical protein